MYLFKVKAEILTWPHTSRCPNLDYGVSALGFRPQEKTGLPGQLLFGSVHTSI